MGKKGKEITLVSLGLVIIFGFTIGGAVITTYGYLIGIPVCFIVGYLIPSIVRKIL